MFTDLVGSTELLVAAGEERFDLVRVDHERIVDGAIRANRGEIVENTGDGFMAVFAGAADAIAAAGELRGRFAERNIGSDLPLGVRIGISAADVTERAGDYHGLTVIEAARLCAAATGDQILASESVCALAGSGGGHDLVPLVELDLKGLPPRAAAAMRWRPDVPGLGAITPGQGQPAGERRPLRRPPR